MLEELKNKNVKMLVGSNSGIATAANASSIPTAILTIIGTIVDYDDKMVKISTAQMSGAIPGKICVNWGNLPTYTPTLENCKTMYVNINNIITITTIED